VRRTTATVFGGLTVGYLYEEQKIYDVVVWGAPETRQSLSNLNDLWIEKPDRSYVRLGDVADVKIAATPALLRHESIAPYLDVVANVRGGQLGVVADEIEDRLERMAFPLEYHWKLLGEYAERVAVQHRLLVVGVAVLIGIFLLLQAGLRSWRLALIAFLALPAALAGGVLAVLASGATLSLGSLVGFLAVLGIAARHGLLLMDHYGRLATQGVPFGLELALAGVRERLAPMAASAAAILAALLPLVLFGQRAGLEIAQPTAIVILGGVLASALFTLFVMPALYVLLGEPARHEADLALEGE